MSTTSEQAACGTTTLQIIVPKGFERAILSAQARALSSGVRIDRSDIVRELLSCPQPDDVGWNMFSLKPEQEVLLNGAVDALVKRKAG